MASTSSASRRPGVSPRADLCTSSFPGRGGRVTRGALAQVRPSHVLGQHCLVGSWVRGAAPSLLGVAPSCYFISFLLHSQKGCVNTAETPLLPVGRWGCLPLASLHHAEAVLPVLPFLSAPAPCGFCPPLRGVCGTCSPARPCPLPCPHPWSHLRETLPAAAKPAGAESAASPRACEPSFTTSNLGQRVQGWCRWPRFQFLFRKMMCEEQYRSPEGSSGLTLPGMWHPLCIPSIAWSPGYHHP